MRERFGLKIESPFSYSGRIQAVERDGGQDRMFRCLPGVLVGAFDPFPHCGQLWAMRQALATWRCNTIWVGLHRDPSVERPQKRKPTLSVGERRQLLEAIRWVSLIEEYETEADLRAILERWCPHLRILGDDYIGEPFTGQELGQEVFYAQRNREWSGTRMCERIAAAVRVCQAATGPVGYDGDYYETRG